MASSQSEFSDRPERSRRIAWALLAKAAVTLAIFCFLFLRLDMAACLAAIQASFGGWLMGAAMANSAPLVLSMLKWDQLLRALHIVVSRWELLRVYMIGFFVSSFLPGVFGGDVVRCYITAMGESSRMNVAATILVERFTGIVALVIMCVVAVAADHSRLATVPTLLLLGSMTCALVGSLFLSTSRRLAVSLTYRTRRWKFARVIQLFYDLHRTFRGFSRRDFLVSVVFSVVFYFSGGLVFFCVCRAFGTGLGFSEVLTVQLLVCLLTVLPISVGGLGLAQAGDVYLLGILGVDAPTALGMSFTRKLIQYLYVCLGGACFIRWQGRSRVARATRVPEDQLEV